MTIALVVAESVGWWTRPEAWAAAALCCLGLLVPGGATLPDEAARQERARRLVRLGALLWGLFHLWTVWMAVGAWRAYRVAGPRATPQDWAVPLAAASQVASAGWAVLTGSVVLGAIVVRGVREGRWMAWLLLACLAASVVLCLVLLPARERSGEPGFMVFLPDPWEARLYPLIDLAGLAALVVAVAALWTMLRQGPSTDPAAREKTRLRLAGSGLVMLSVSMEFALLRWYLVAGNIVILGPKITARDFRAVPRWFVLPGFLVALSFVPLAFAFLHLKRERSGS